MKVQNMLVRHRPLLFAEFLGNARIKRSVSNLLRGEAFPPGLLLTGPAGCGKTTLAYLIIRRLRCMTARPGDIEPCLTCSGCDVDLDPASPYAGEGLHIVNCSGLTRSSLAALLDHARYAYPSLIFFLDEAHRADQSMQEALLTFLESPRENAVVIMSMINADRLDEPLLQRLHPFEVKPPSPDAVAAWLRGIWTAVSERPADPRLIDHIIAKYGPIPRRCINGLRQCLAEGTLSLEDLASEDS